MTFRGLTQLEHRAAAVSGRLNVGVDLTQVADWAGRSVHVLLKVYVKCVAGRDALARRRIERFLSGDDAARDLDP
jgi:hypothetical protein